VSGTQGWTVVSETVSALPTQSAPPAELPASAAELATAAAERLGWSGTVLPELLVLGRRVSLLVELSPAAHAERICLGQEPVTDRATVSTWAFPEFAGRVPEPALRVVGAIAVARHWRTGLAHSVPFLRYCPSAVVLPTSALLSHDYVGNCLPKARSAGLAVLNVEPDGAIDVDLAGRPPVRVGEPDGNHRWVSEIAYARLLELPEFSAA